MNPAPTVGRVVHFTCPNGDVCAAIVCHVWNDTCVNLAWFDHNGVASNATSVLYNPDPENGYTWRWPARV